tara:strand:+ start:2085 stop:2387 length:303 start_codon:yes stop_codon:yes gene_type:complete
MIPISYWKTTEGQFSDKSWDKPLYSSEPNSAPTDCDYFTIRKTFEDSDGNTQEISEQKAQAIANHLQFRGDVRESKSGESWRVYRNKLNNTFDLSVLSSK